MTSVSCSVATLTSSASLSATATLSDEPWRIRPARPSDVRFIMDSWGKSYRYFRATREEDRAGFQRAYRDVVGDLVAASKVVVVCLRHQSDELTCACGCNTDDGEESAILAWACGQPLKFRLLLHYVYVKSPYRRHGFARTLVQRLRDQTKGPQKDGRTLPASVVCTHITMGWCRDWAKARGWGVSELQPWTAYVSRRLTDE